MRKLNETSTKNTMDTPMIVLLTAVCIGSLLL